MKLVLIILGVIAIMCIVHMIGRALKRRGLDREGLPPDDRYPLW